MLARSVAESVAELRVIHRPGDHHRAHAQCHQGECALSSLYGDLSAAVLARIALGALRRGLTIAIPTVWLFNVVGVADLMYANISTFKDQVDPASLGAAYYLAVLNVPAMIVVHVLIFVYLMRHHRLQPPIGTLGRGP